MHDLSALRAQQITLARSVSLTDGVELDRIKRIAGTDVGFEHNGAITRAAIVILSYPDLKLIEYHVARLATEMPYIPGFLSFREYPAVLAAWQKLTVEPDVVMVDGQGIAHPRGLGIASHLGLLLDKPTVGIGKSRLFGSHAELATQANSVIPLSAGKQQIGWLLRSKLRCKPLYISPGHRMSVASSLSLTQACLRGYRLPEPTRWADAVASNKPAFRRWLAQPPSM